MPLGVGVGSGSSEGMLGGLGAFGGGCSEVWVPEQGELGGQGPPRIWGVAGRPGSFVGLKVGGQGAPGCRWPGPAETPLQCTHWTGCWCSGCSWSAPAPTCGRCHGSRPGCSPRSAVSGVSSTRVRRDLWGPGWGHGDPGWGHGGLAPAPGSLRAYPSSPTPLPP